MPGSLAKKGLQDYSRLDTDAEADNSIPAASTISFSMFFMAFRTIRRPKLCPNCAQSRTRRPEVLGLSFPRYAETFEATGRCHPPCLFSGKARTDGRVRQLKMSAHVRAGVCLLPAAFD